MHSLFRMQQKKKNMTKRREFWWNNLCTLSPKALALEELLWSGEWRPLGFEKKALGNTPQERICVHCGPK